MKKSTCRSVSTAFLLLWLFNSASVLASVAKNFVAPTNTTPPSGRLIVKFKPNSLPKGLSVAQIKSQLSQPLSQNILAQLQAAAGVAVSELHAVANGAHVLAIAGQPNQQAVNKAIADIGNLSNVEYVEEDKILSIQAAPNDTYYTTGPTRNPGLWAMQPVTPVAAPAPGGTGSYGANFETAWNLTQGSGVVVAVVDTGITPNVDIVGVGGTVAVGAGSNLVSIGYDFITDCRIRGAAAVGGCVASTASASAYVAPSAGATDAGDFITAQDIIDNPYWSTLSVSNSSWHGTHVAGTIAALGNNGVGVIGGAYAAKILPVRVLGKGGGFTSDIANGIMWAAGVHAIANPNPAKVINISLGGSGACSATEQNAINAAVAAGAVVVVAAGNSNADVADSSPANCLNVIAVAAIARDGSRAAYSNFSSPASNVTNPINVTLAAQGSDQGNYPATFDPGILSTLNIGAAAPIIPANVGGSNYIYYQGTSMATPHVSAAAALMLAMKPALTPAQIKAILSASVSLTAFPSFVSGFATWDCALKNNCGAGILNANLAVQNSAAALSVSPATLDFTAVPVGGTGLPQTFTLTNTSGASVQAGAATVTGINATSFSVGTNTCTGNTIASNGTCQITMGYAPTAGGLRTANLSVAITGTSAFAMGGLTGSAEAPLTTTNVMASTVTVGQSTTVSISFTNPNAAWRLGAVSLSAPSIMATSADNCSNTTLASGASCSITVTITPTTAGAYSGTVSLALSGGGTPAVAGIKGVANAPPSSGGGRNIFGCSIMPVGGNPDFSLPFTLLVILAYWLRQRRMRSRGEI